MHVRQASNAIHGASRRRSNCHLIFRHTPFPRSNGVPLTYRRLTSVPHHAHHIATTLTINLTMLPKIPHNDLHSTSSPKSPHSLQSPQPNCLNCRKCFNTFTTNSTALPLPHHNRYKPPQPQLAPWTLTTVSLMLGE